MQLINHHDHANASHIEVHDVTIIHQFSYHVYDPLQDYDTILAIMQTCLSFLC